MIKPPGKIRRFLGFFWNSVSALRRIIGNLLFLLLIGFLIAVVFFDSDEDVPDGVALILSPEGNIVEQNSETVLSSDIFGEAAKDETLLKDIIDVIDFAKEDERVEVLVLDLRKMKGAGISKLQTIGAGLERFQSSGKQIIAFGDYFNQHQYYLASSAAKVFQNSPG
jgi:protease-4